MSARSDWPSPVPTGLTPGQQWMEIRDDERWLSRASFYIRADDDVVELVHVATQDDLLHNGLATAVVVALFEALPGHAFTDPGELDSPAGEGLVEHVRSLGYPLHVGCFMPGRQTCSCGLGSTLPG